MVRHVLAILFLILTGAMARAETVEGVKLWVEVVDEGRPIHPQEMVILRVHGRFRVPVTLEKMQNAPLEQFRHVAVGGDRWYEVFEDGLPAKAFLRTLAVFPQRSGTLTVEPFIHHVTLIDARGKQVKHDITTAPVELTVVPAPVDPKTWWMAARQFSVSADWTVPPEELGIGQSTRLTLTLEAQGVLDDQIPPPPTLTASGLIVFPGNTTRVTKVGLGIGARLPGEMPLREQSLRRPGRLEWLRDTPEGPVARVTYAWDIRPTSDKAVQLPPIRFVWFDSIAGRLRTETIEGRTVQLKPEGVDGKAVVLERALGIAASSIPARPETGAWGLLAVCGAALAGFGLTLTGALAVLSPGSLGSAAGALRRRLALVRARRALRRAAMREDGAAFLRAADVLRDLGRPCGAASLAAVVGKLYDGRGDRPDWREIRRGL